jgi:hypothetical protein
MSAGDEALRTATGLVHGWTDAAVPRMARSDAHAESPEVLRFSEITKRIAMERIDHDSLRWRLSPKALTHIEHLSP